MINNFNGLGKKKKRTKTVRINILHSICNKENYSIKRLIMNHLSKLLAVG